MKEGVIIGCDEKQEWLLPWWWRHFHQHNSHYPVVFFDFGMSLSARSWCQEKGQLVTIESSLISENPDQYVTTEWQAKEKNNEKEIRDLQALRKMWFKKPVAMLASPFSRSLWLDLDCEVRGNIEPLFTFPLTSAKIAVASMETSIFLRPTGENLEIPYYGTGVVSFEKDCPLLHLWVSGIPEGSRKICTDDDLLSILIDRFKIPITPLPLIFNWEILKLGFNPNALIYHWAGKAGKEQIKKRIELPFLD